MMTAPRTRPPTGGYQWRRSRGLLVISELIRAYAAVRWPRGPYRTPLPGDLRDRRSAP